ncbi:MAG: class I SAM-dependent methyltransferase [Lentisphaerales bacterium]|nr:class I SAM-dependent methyltransferase [Lentisphaerales bacterium]
MSQSQFTININYPTSANNSPRWGYDSPPHPILKEIISKYENRYKSALKYLTRSKRKYRQINIQAAPDKSEAPHLSNPWLPGLDSLALYSFIKKYKPIRYLEVGSGSSTKFARKSIDDHHLNTIITSIDPQPRSEIDIICDKVIRQAVESVDLKIFDQLEKNDILFIDNSHRSFMNSDVTVTFLDIIPRLKPGVIVQIHDIFLPYDYPPSWDKRYYNEQYLLAAYLLADTNKFDILLPNAFVSRTQSLHSIVQPVFEDLDGVSKGGGSFWLKIKK